jgi:DNA-binding transcriptional LysR family regulator
MDIPWELYRTLLAITRHGSLSAAARALRLTQPTIGRHLSQLEHVLATPLFTRSPQGMTPTEAALALIPLAEAMESAAHAIARTASAATSEIAGTIRLTASEVIGAEVLPSILADFASAHPEINFELHLSNQTENLLRRDADIAVRMLRPTQEGLAARRLGETTIGLFAHRHYLAGRALPETLAELAAHRLIGIDREPVAGMEVTPAMFSLRTDSHLAQLAALRAGYGIGACQIGVARRDPALVRILPGQIAIQLEMWLVTHEDLRAIPRIRRLFDHLASGLLEYLK